MMRILKLVLFALTTSLFISTAYAIEPSQVKPMMNAQMPGKAFKRHLGHANFMPNLMPRLLGSYKHGNPLKLTKEQFEKLKKFHKDHFPHMKAMVQKVIHLEANARKLALEGKTNKEVLKVGEESLKLRSNIMHGKLKCRAFVRSVLTPAQFEMIAKNYYHPKKMMAKPAPAAKVS